MTAPVNSGGENNPVPDPPETTPSPEHTPPTVPAPDDSRHELQERVSSLEGTVTELQNIVASLTTDADSSPAKGPWISRKIW